MRSHKPSSSGRITADEQHGLRRAAAAAPRPAHRRLRRSAPCLPRRCHASVRRGGARRRRDEAGARWPPSAGCRRTIRPGLRGRRALDCEIAYPPCRHGALPGGHHQRSRPQTFELGQRHVVGNIETERNAFAFAIFADHTKALAPAPIWRIEDGAQQLGSAGANKSAAIRQSSPRCNWKEAESDPCLSG